MLQTMEIGVGDQAGAKRTGWSVFYFSTAVESRCYGIAAKEAGGGKRISFGAGHEKIYQDWR